ncbi:MAG TPA: hypothetical protein VLC91_02440 [Spongiibacteraceae bacterium]|nr:hypothetical protein [Spongiibacteraceae bacterium]
MDLSVTINSRASFSPAFKPKTSNAADDTDIHAAQNNPELPKSPATDNAKRAWIIVDEDWW